MEKNQTSCPKAVCEKIFRAITFGPAFSTIRRISNRQHSPSSPAKPKHARNPPLPNADPPLRTIDVKTKLTSPQRPKPTSQEGSQVPIKFEYATRLPTQPTENPKPTTTALNGSTQINGQVPLALMAQQPKTPKSSTDVVQSRKTIMTAGNDHHHAQNKSYEQIQVENEGKKSTPHYDDRFSEFIDQTKKRIQEHGEVNSPKMAGHGHGIGKDPHFSDYIKQTKRKIRTTSSLKDRSESFFK